MFRPGYSPRRRGNNQNGFNGYMRRAYREATGDASSVIDDGESNRKDVLQGGLGGKSQDPLQGPSGDSDLLFAPRLRSLSPSQLSSTVAPSLSGAHSSSVSGDTSFGCSAWETEEKKRKEPAKAVAANDVMVQKHRQVGSYTDTEASAWQNRGQFERSNRSPHKTSIDRIKEKPKSPLTKDWAEEVQAVRRVLELSAHEHREVESERDEAQSEAKQLRLYVRGLEEDKEREERVRAEILRDEVALKNTVWNLQEERSEANKMLLFEEWSNSEARNLLQERKMAHDKLRRDYDAATAQNQLREEASVRREISLEDAIRKQLNETRAISRSLSNEESLQREAQNHLEERKSADDSLRREYAAAMAQNQIRQAWEEAAVRREISLEKQVEEEFNEARAITKSLHHAESLQREAQILSHKRLVAHDRMRDDYAAAAAKDRIRQEWEEAAVRREISLEKQVEEEFNEARAITKSLHHAESLQREAQNLSHKRLVAHDRLREEYAAAAAKDRIRQEWEEAAVRREISLENQVQERLNEARATTKSLHQEESLQREAQSVLHERLVAHNVLREEYAAATAQNRIRQEREDAAIRRERSLEDELQMELNKARASTKALGTEESLQRVARQLVKVKSASEKTLQEECDTQMSHNQVLREAKDAALLRESAMNDEARNLMEEMRSTETSLRRETLLRQEYESQAAQIQAMPENFPETHARSLLQEITRATEALQLEESLASEAQRLLVENRAEEAHWKHEYTLEVAQNRSRHVSENEEQPTASGNTVVKMAPPKHGEDVLCKSCGASVPVGDFCTGCGESILPKITCVGEGCDTLLAFGAVFCHECGVSQKKTVPCVDRMCGYPLAVGAHFCDKCGSPQ
eukprot:TRINITY_DN5920_c0_g1_i1.p1 TRINITY_DN5920_c0_g1~~TRINITY_DN5920_c0_g1_i1.p1  ORF type:complete len:869 (-),score=179.93 TRINITY_DN5920_c0_g1_i1:104-2710(-)